MCGYTVSILSVADGIKLTRDALQLAAIFSEHEVDTIELEATSLDRRLRSWWRYCWCWCNVLIKTSAATTTTTIRLIAVIVSITAATEATTTRSV